MPLKIVDLPGVPDSERKSVGVWMVSEQAEAVWVLVIYEALWSINPYSQPLDVAAASAIFKENCGRGGRIEAAASKKFDTKGVGEGEYEGQPIVVLQSHDF